MPRIKDAYHGCKSNLDRYRYFASVYGYFEQRLPQAQIASYLGLTRESFGRVKKALRSKSKTGD